jgi:hypothetical protein
LNLLFLVANAAGKHDVINGKQRIFQRSALWGHVVTEAVDGELPRRKTCCPQGGRPSTSILNTFGAWLMNGTG